MLLLKPPFILASSTYHGYPTVASLFDTVPPPKGKVGYDTATPLEFKKLGFQGKPGQLLPPLPEPAVLSTFFIQKEL